MPKILIAEDDDAMREFLTQALSRQGYAITAVANGADALDAMSDAEECDLLLADIRMPGIDGISLARCARRDFPKIPIVFVTGFANEIRSEMDFARNSVEILPKPLRLAELVTVVDRVLAA